MEHSHPPNHALNGSDLLMPRQPLLVLDAETYEWMEIMVCGISHCYTFVVNDTMLDKARVVPDGSVDLFINCRPQAAKALFYGSPTRVADIGEYIDDLQVGDVIFGVRLLPGQAWWPGGLPMTELTDGGLSLRDCGMGDELLERLLVQDTFINRVKAFMAYYMPRYQERYIDSNQTAICRQAVRCITEYRGALPIGDLSEAVGYSSRYLGRVFQQGVGMSPKKFSEIIRFQQVLTEVRSERRLSDISGDLEFFDQSHLLKTFRKFAGMSPQTYKKALIQRGGTPMERINGV